MVIQTPFVNGLLSGNGHFLHNTFHRGRLRSFLDQGQLGAWTDQDDEAGGASDCCLQARQIKNSLASEGLA